MIPMINSANESWRKMYGIQQLKPPYNLDKGLCVKQHSDSLMHPINLYFLRIIALTILILSGCSTSPAKSQKDESLIINEQKVDVLFVPGLGMGFQAFMNPKTPQAKNYTEWEEFNQLFEEKGFNLKVAEIPAMASVEKLSNALEKFIRREFPADQGRKFHIIAKSMGGLAVRKALSDSFRESEWNSEIKPLSDQVITFTTIATSHKGSPVADMLMRGEACTFAGKLLMIFSPLGKFFNNEDGFGFNAAGSDLTTYSSALKIKDDPKMTGRTFSFGASLNCDAACKSEFHDRKEIFAETLMCWHDMMVKNHGLENDGLVTVESATYGKYVETLDGDHIAISEQEFLYKGKSIWKKVFSRALDNIIEFEAISPK
jgi:hypothetical protein